MAIRSSCDLYWLHVYRHVYISNWHIPRTNDEAFYLIHQCFATKAVLATWNISTQNACRSAYIALRLCIVLSLILHQPYITTETNREHQYVYQNLLTALSGQQTKGSVTGSGCFLPIVAFFLEVVRSIWWSESFVSAKKHEILSCAEVWKFPPLFVPETFTLNVCVIVCFKQENRPFSVD